MTPLIESVDDKNILALEIDGQEYLFKLSDHQDREYLKELGALVDSKIQENKKNFAIKDYHKLLVLTCLNLAEDAVVLRNRLVEISKSLENQTPQDENLEDMENRDESIFNLQNLELIDRLESLNESLNESLKKKLENSDGINEAH